jgi:hypothetical protein
MTEAAQIAQINWLVAQNFAWDPKFGGQYSFGEVQAAIWELIGYTNYLGAFNGGIQTWLTNNGTVPYQQADVLKDRLISALEKVAPDETTWKLPEHTLSSRKTSSVELDPELQPADLPEEFVRTKTTYSADKTALAAALKAGSQIDGAKLVERRSWTIK